MAANIASRTDSSQVTNLGTPIPLNAIMFSLTILVVIALINIGSTAALNTIIALLTSATSFSYALSICWYVALHRIYSTYFRFRSNTA